MFNTPEFQALRREYLDGALQRCAHLEQEAALLRSGGEVDLQALRQEVHKFRGSGGFYGFKELSAASAVAEDRIIQTIAGELNPEPLHLAGLIDQVVAAARQAAEGMAGA